MPLVAAAAIPAWIGAGGAVAGGLLARSAAGKAASAQAPMLDLAKQQAARAGQAFRIGLPMTQDAGSYFTRLLTGDRGTMRATLAPEIDTIRDSYKGAAAGVRAGRLQGAEKENALAELNRERVGKIGSLFTMARPAAAQALSGMGTGLMGFSNNAAGSALSGFGDLSRIGLADKAWSYQSGQDFGGLLTDILSRFKVGGGSAWKLPAATHDYGGIATLPSLG